jgi:hypothetical protein
MIQGQQEMKSRTIQNQKRFECCTSSMMIHVLRSLIRSIGASAVRASAPDKAPATASLHCGAALRFLGWFLVSDGAAMV